MANASVVELARLLENGMEALSAAPIDLRPAAASRVVRLPQPVPLTVRYELVELRDSLLLMHTDIYRTRRESLAELIFAELSRQGISGAAVDSGAVLHFASARIRSVPVSQLMREH
jgi:hypothetical protein